MDRLLTRSERYSQDAPPSHRQNGVPLSQNTSTYPIPMPISRSTWDNHGNHGNHDSNGANQGTRDYAADDRPCYLSNHRYSPFEQASRSSRSSICFSPNVKLEDDRDFPLQKPLPKSKSDQPELLHIMTDVEPFTYKSRVEGSDLGESPHSGNGSRSCSNSSRSRRSTFRDQTRVTAAHKFLMFRPRASSSDYDEQVVAEDEEDYEMNDGVESLTSESTMSPMSEFHTPPPSSIGNLFNREFMPLSAMSDDPGGGGAGDGGGGGRGGRGESPFSLQPRKSGEIIATRARNKSLVLERPRSQSRARRRVVSERPFNSCSSDGVSPASLFLSSFGKKALSSPQMVEPDSEGQEVGNYVLGKEIARGGFSIVRETFTIDENGVKLKQAVKIVRKRVHSDESENDLVQANFDHEISLWRFLHHANILPLIAVMDTPFATFAFMKLNSDGTLFDLLRKPENRHGLSARRAQRYGFQLACALWYLHREMLIVHGDIKLENCLVDLSSQDDGGKILLCDFGLARFVRNDSGTIDEDELNDQQRSTSDKFYITGSLQYAAPELIQTLGQESLPLPAADIWAFAVTVYALHTGSLPFHHDLQPKLASMILKGAWDVDRLRNCWGLTEAGKTQTENVVQVVKGGLCTSINRRWNIGDVFDSAWFERCT